MKSKCKGYKKRTDTKGVQCGKLKDRSQRKAQWAHLSRSAFTRQLTLNLEGKLTGKVNFKLVIEIYELQNSKQDRL